jgi:5-methylcytosine-specific restriction endonuclease McrA
MFQKVTHRRAINLIVDKGFKRPTIAAIFSDALFGSESRFWCFPSSLFSTIKHIGKNKHLRNFGMQLLAQKVLVINRAWQGYEETTVQIALCDLCRGSCTGIDTETMRPVTWEEWCRLPVREGDRAIRTIHGPVRVPTVICKSRYAKMPKKRPKWSKRAIKQRDGAVCQITGKHAPDGNIDHVQARSKGGQDTWTNTVWSAKEVNAKKADKSLAELGWKLIRKPVAPPELPMNRLIPPRHPDWQLFLPADR